MILADINMEVQKGEFVCLVNQAAFLRVMSWLEKLTNMLEPVNLVHDVFDKLPKKFSCMMT